ncbi:MAG: O-antigen ligase family protein [Oscillospiraceae bacterium]|nr:O-antigen ligase family protein [Oscillospiraceae bacterium]
MKHDSPLDEKLMRLLPAFIVIYCVFQPLLDVAGYWQQVLSLGNALTMAIRVLLLIISVLLGFLLSNRRFYYGLLFAILAALTVLHITANASDGYQNPLSDLASLFRIYVLPITTVCFITFLSRDTDRAFHAMKIGLCFDFAIILLVEFLSVVTGTNRGTYAREQIGVLGWFVWGNCQSAILSMLSPLAICWTLLHCRDRLIPVALVTLTAETALFFFGTRLTFLSLIASGMGLSLCIVLIDRKNWKKAVLILLITVAFCLAYPASPAAERLQSLAETNKKNGQEIHEVLPTDDHQADLADEAVDPETLEPVYRRFCNTMVDRFGIERVAEKYGYTLDAAVLGDARLGKRIVCELVMENASCLCHLFGLNVNEFRISTLGTESNTGSADPDDGIMNYEVENDYYGVYFVTGVVGIAGITFFLLFFGISALRSVLREPQNALTMEMLGFLGAYCFGLIHALFTTSVLRRNNASVYLALVLAGLWYLSRDVSTGKPDALARFPSLRPERRGHGAK